MDQGVVDAHQRDLDGPWPVTVRAIRSLGISQVELEGSGGPLQNFVAPFVVFCALERGLPGGEVQRDPILGPTFPVVVTVAGGWMGGGAGNGVVATRE